MKHLAMCLSAAAILLALPISLLAVTINIPADYATIQAGIDNATDGDTVLVAPGTYVENLDYLGKAVAVIGSEGADSTTLLPNDAYSSFILIKDVAGLGSELSGFTITGGGLRTVIDIQNASPLIAENVLIDNNHYPGITVYMIKCSESDAVVRRNFITDNDGPLGIYLGTGSEDMEIYNNTIVAIKGIILAVNGGNVFNNIITGGSHGLQIDTIQAPGSSFALLDYNNVWNNTVNYDIGISPGTNDISDNAMFLIESLGDYRLDINSPCIDAGNSNPVYNDLDGSRNDIGASPLAETIAQPIIHRIFWSRANGGNNHWYGIMARPFFWNDAKDSAAVLSHNGQFGYLAALTSAAENQFVTDSLVAGIAPWTNLNQFWLGGYDMESFWFWVTGESSFYYNWDIDEPGVAFVSHAITLVGATGLWRAEPPLDEANNLWLWSIVEWGDTSPPDLPVTIDIPLDFVTIQEAIDSANWYDTIMVAPGEYIENINYKRKGVVLISSGGPEVTTLQPADQNIPTIIIADTVVSGAELSGFTITGADQTNSIYASYAGLKVSNNHFLNMTGTNVVAFSRSVGLFINNLFVGNSSGSCVSSYKGETEFINNTFDRVYRALYFLDGTSSIDNNIFANCATSEIHISPDALCEVNYNCFYNSNIDYNLLSGTGNFAVDPQFVDTANYNYNLSPTSLCINAGNPDPIYNDPDGSRNDVGAYPFDLTTQTSPLAINLDIVSEYRLRVASQSPAIGWTFFDNSGSPAGYQIEVGTDQDWSVAERWATGQIFSADTSAVYAGSALDDGTTYYYRVQLYNGSIWGDWSETWFFTNTPPEIPTGLQPAEGSTLMGVYAVSSDAESDPLTFDFELYDDEYMTELLDSAVNYGGWWQPDVPVGEVYWWRMRADDGYERSDFTLIQSFTFDWSTCCSGMRGNMDFDPDDRVNVADIAYEIKWLFGIPSGPAPVCAEEANANGDPDEKTGIADISFLVSWLFGIPSGPPPPPCPW